MPTLELTRTQADLLLAAQEIAQRHRNDAETLTRAAVDRVAQAVARVCQDHGQAAPSDKANLSLDGTSFSWTEPAATP